MQNTSEPRRQTPEETMNRIAGVPKTPEEQQAEREQLEQERTDQAQRVAGVQPAQRSSNTPAPVQSHSEHERQHHEREKA